MTHAFCHGSTLHFGFEQRACGMRFLYTLLGLKAISDIGSYQEYPIDVFVQPIIRLCIGMHSFRAAKDGCHARAVVAVGPNGQLLVDIFIL